MRDKVHEYPDITVTGTSATCVPADSADFGAISINTAKIAEHHTAIPVGGLVMVYQPQALIASGNIYTLAVQDSADNSSFITKLSGQAVTLGANMAAYTKLYMPLPLTHRRYLRPAVVTGTTYAGSVAWKCWLEFGPPIV